MSHDALARFRSADSMIAARLEAATDAGDYRRREGFYQAAVHLLREADAAEDWRDRDPLVWPALYCFRHYLELELKFLAREHTALVRSNPAKTHRLRQLWGPIREAFRTCFGAAGDAPAGVVDEAIAVYEVIDPAGDGLRYSTTRSGNPAVPRDLYLDAKELLEMVQAVKDVFEPAEMAFQAHDEAIVDAIVAMQEMDGSQ